VKTGGGIERKSNGLRKKEKRKEEKMITYMIVNIIIWTLF
tara:strand:- start:737 stop:856 length:120 start_codon:yes stop_codon:yes gene_type:complete